MKFSQPSSDGLLRKSRKRTKNLGIALISTLSLWVAVAFLSLGAVSLRRTLSESAYIAARSNACLSVMLALGDLQKNLGDDRRVTCQTMNARTHILFP